METITQATLLELARELGEFRVSLYLPTSRQTTAQAESRLRLKNLLEAAERQLVEQGAAAVAARALVERIRESTADPAFWDHMGDGLAILADESGTRIFRVGHPVPEMLQIAKRFYLPPLLDSAAEHRGAYLLCVSQKEVRLWHVTADRIAPVDAPALPMNIEATLDLDDRQNLSRQAHGGMRHGRFDRATAFHGQGGPSDEMKDDLRQFLRSVDRGLPPEVKRGELPLIFAGVGYLYPLFADVTTHPRLHPEFLAGNAALVSTSELQARVLEILTADADRARERLFEQCRQQYSHLDHAPSLGEILKSLVTGEVAVLCVPRGRQYWGTFDPESLETKRVDGPRPGAEELANLAVHAALTHGTQVLAVDPSQLPPAAEMGVLFRHYAPALEKWRAVHTAN